MKLFIAQSASALGLSPQAINNVESQTQDQIVALVRTALLTDQSFGNGILNLSLGNFLGTNPAVASLTTNSSFMNALSIKLLGASNNYGLATKGDISALAQQTSPTNTAYVQAVATNPAFVTAVASQILSGSNNYGIAVKQSQSLSFPAIPTITITPGKKFTNTVTASTALPVTQIVGNTAIATISNNVLTILGAGSTTVTASQAGNALYNPASASQPLIVNKGTQTLTFTAIPNQTFSPFKTVTLKATSTAALTNNTYLIDNGAIGTISNNVLLLLGTGTATITATNSGNTYFAPAFATQKLIVK